MTARSEARRGSGPGWVPAVLLAVLVHLLMCAHGPVGGGSGPSVDAVSVVSVSCPAPADRHDGAGHRAECAGFDQPVTVCQESGGAEEPVAAGAADAPAAVPSPVPPAPLGGAGDGGRARAVLGVWRI
ncbi:hypothetical protein ACIQBJ_01705 [Kitasatospora sp. NPDC088391]|uniref:hypothetical protein n=1 Tax=Kitasatospora sp. NPDC088391 TaxID=3364074 RepID=UPI0037FC0D44